MPRRNRPLLRAFLRALFRALLRARPGQSLRASETTEKQPRAPVPWSPAPRSAPAWSRHPRFPAPAAAAVRFFVAPPESAQSSESGCRPSPPCTRCSRSPPSGSREPTTPAFPAGENSLCQSNTGQRSGLPLSVRRLRAGSVIITRVLLRMSSSLSLRVMVLP